MGKPQFNPLVWNAELEEWNTTIPVPELSGF